MPIVPGGLSADRLEPAAARPQEQLLVELLPALQAAGPRVLCTTAGWGQFAAAAARCQPGGRTVLHFLDQYQAIQAGSLLSAERLPVEVLCAPDFPAEEFDLAALPLSFFGEAELARDFLQSAHDRLRTGGLLAAATDNPRDTWLAQQMHALFDRVERRAGGDAAVYLGHKDRPLKKRKNFACEFVFRDGERLIRAVSRPGVFAHRRVDPGARQLLSAMNVLPGSRVLDIGCGSGVLSLAAANRAEQVTVHAMDSNARAIECVARGATLNRCDRVTAELGVAGEYEGREKFQLALANPPYYANFEITRRFVLTAHDALAPGGEVLLVTKMPDWYVEQMPRWFGQVRLEPSKGYWVVRGKR